MNEAYRTMITKLIRERPDGFFYHTGWGWEVFRLGGMSDWVHEFDMPNTSYLMNPQHVEGIDHCRIPYVSGGSAQTDAILRSLRQAGVYGVAVFDTHTYSTAWLVFFSEDDSILAKSLIEMK